MSSITPEQDKAINQIMNDISDALDTIDKLKPKVDAFGIQSGSIEHIQNTGLNVKNSLLLSYENINEVDRRQGTILADPMSDNRIKNVAFNTILTAFRSYTSDFLPSYENVIVPLVNSVQAAQPSTPSVQTPTAQADVVNEKSNEQTPAQQTPTTQLSTKQPQTPAPKTPDTQAQTSTSNPKPTNPTPNNSDVAQAQQLVNDALTAKSKLQQTYDSIAKFWKDANANKYVHGLIGAARAILHAYGIPI
jgi:hypothetical protein